MNDVWKRIFKNYIADFHAIDRIYSDGIIDCDMAMTIKNKLLVDIICAMESELAD